MRDRGRSGCDEDISSDIKLFILQQMRDRVVSGCDEDHSVGHQMYAADMYMRGTMASAVKCGHQAKAHLLSD